MEYLHLATEFLVNTIKGRYVTLNHIEPFFNSLNSVRFKKKILGKSVLDKPIIAITFGSGSKRILMWSQMHGNESTTTKGIIDFLNFLNSNHPLAYEIEEKYTLCIVPILNPDGAEAYTRVNANGVDLNRDAKNRTQPESLVLHQLYTSFKPDLCFNLHDQRTIFGTENTGLPATMSFLSPAFNETRDYNETRLKAISIINKINTALQAYIPNQIGRFDDSFNDNCIGDYLMTQHIPTILFEAGHFQNDYERDLVRKFVFIALVSSFLEINENVIVDNDLPDYLKIPQNKKCFFDFYYKNISVLDENIEKTINFAAQFEEVLIDSSIVFIAKISEIIKEEGFFGHKEYNGNNMLFSSETKNFPEVGEKANFSLNNEIKFCNGFLKEK